MTINNRILGVAGIIGAPFLAIEMLSGDIVKSTAPQATTGISAVLDIIYMAGWMCSIYAFLRSGAADGRKWTRMTLKVQLVLLTIANIYNIWSGTGIGTNTLAFKIVDVSWPLSNICMLVCGMAIIKANVLSGWKKYSVLIVGLWLPVSTIVMMIFGRTSPSFYAGLIYSVIAWLLMGLAAYKTPEPDAQRVEYPELALVE